MAFRIDTAIIRGEINNEVHGQVTGKLWLADREEPIILRLRGNAHRDIAGCHLSFVNTKVKPQATTKSLATEQEGSVGDMTASRKVKIPTIPDEEIYARIDRKEPIPTRLSNCLYLEWFSQANGRVVIEGSDFKIRVSEAQWTLAPEEEAEQIDENTLQMRNFIEEIADRLSDEEPGGGEGRPLDEFEWEERLKESDRITDAYMEALDKYRDHPDQDRAVAHAMGWDAIAEDNEGLEPWDEDDMNAGMDFRDEDDDEDEDDGDSSAMDDEDDEFFFGEGDDDELDQHHPLYERVHSFAVILTGYAQARGLMDPVDKENGSPSPMQNVVFATMDLAAKLAGALNGLGSGLDPEPGLVIAWLKRGLPVLDRALSGCAQALTEKRADPGWIAEVRMELFEIRTQMLELIQQFRNQLP
jgi:hypothetical protein